MKSYFIDSDGHIVKPMGRSRIIYGSPTVIVEYEDGYTRELFESQIKHVFESRSRLEPLGMRKDGSSLAVKPLFSSFSGDYELGQYLNNVRVNGSYKIPDSKQRVQVFGMDIMNFLGIRRLI